MGLWLPTEKEMENFKPETIQFQLSGFCMPGRAADFQSNKTACPLVSYMNQLGYKSATCKIIKKGELRVNNCDHEVVVTDKEEAGRLYKDEFNVLAKLQEICFACNGNRR